MPTPQATVGNDMFAELQARGPEFAMAMELPRIWATGAQVFISPDSSILVFREQNSALDENEQPTFLVKNVASLIMPTQVLRDIHKIIGEQLANLDGREAE